MSEFGQLLIAEVRKVAALNPDYVYGPPLCMYLNENGRPSCIIGHALFNLGIYTYSNPEWEGKGITELLGLLGHQIDPVEMNWLNAVQRAQDGRVHRKVTTDDGYSLNQYELRRSWGKSIECADRALAQYGVVLAHN